MVDPRIVRSSLDLYELSMTDDIKRVVDIQPCFALLTFSSHKTFFLFPVCDCKCALVYIFV